MIAGDGYNYLVGGRCDNELTVHGFYIKLSGNVIILCVFDNGFAVHFGRIGTHIGALGACRETLNGVFLTIDGKLKRLKTGDALFFAGVGDGFAVCLYGDLILVRAVGDFQPAVGYIKGDLEVIIIINELCRVKIHGIVADQYTGCRCYSRVIKIILGVQIAAYCSIIALDELSAAGISHRLVVTGDSNGYGKLVYGQLAGNLIDIELVSNIVTGCILNNNVTEESAVICVGVGALCYIAQAFIGIAIGQSFHGDAVDRLLSAVIGNILGFTSESNRSLCRILRSIGHVFGDGCSDFHIPAGEVVVLNGDYFGSCGSRGVPYDAFMHYVAVIIMIICKSAVVALVICDGIARSCSLYAGYGEIIVRAAAGKGGHTVGGMICVLVKIHAGGVQLYGVAQGISKCSLVAVGALLSIGKLPSVGVILALNKSSGSISYQFDALTHGVGNRTGADALGDRIGDSLKYLQQIFRVVRVIGIFFVSGCRGCYVIAQEVSDLGAVFFKPSAIPAYIIGGTEAYGIQSRRIFEG